MKPAAFTLCLLPFAALGESVGYRRVYVAGMALFTLASLLCGLSPNLETLIACRVLQGMGGVMMMPVGRLTLARTYGKADLVRVMSFVAVPSLIGPMIGPVASRRPNSVRKRTRCCCIPRAARCCWASPRCCRWA